MDKRRVKVTRATKRKLLKWSIEKALNCMDDVSDIDKHRLTLKFLAVLVVPSLAFFALSHAQSAKRTLCSSDHDTESACFHSCTFHIVESIPENITFGATSLPETTFRAWNSLIRNSRSDLLIAAYKSSLRGKHVLGAERQLFSQQGEQIFDALLEAGSTRGVSVRILENYPPKDKGDNEDGISLAKRGAATRRYLNFQKVLGKGTMHSKFIVSDKRSFYLGSANLDWRSLSQKMELGVLVNDCSCLAQDLSAVFNSYWGLTSNETDIGNDGYQLKQSEALFNMTHPLVVSHYGVRTEVFIATSPRQLNAPYRTWDLDAILRAINEAQNHLYIHVMDYFPMFIYSKPKRFWPVIDNALRRAIVRGVEVKMLVAALHYPALGLRFLDSLETLNGLNGTIEVRIFKVPTSTSMQTIMIRERRTHNKFVVTDDTVIIGTSNWSGDYFDGGSTGAAFVARQKGTGPRPLVKEMKEIFLRDWEAEYSHKLSDYIEQCLEDKKASFCEVEKDPSLLAK